MKLNLYLIGILLVVVGIGISSAPEGQDGNGSVVANRETVVLLHGLGRNKAAMWLLAWRIEDAGFDVIRIGYDSLHETPGQILAGVSREIDACCKALSQPVHYVGHSLGGLVIRAYLAEREWRNRGRVVLIGTPNNGTPLVDEYKDTWWMNLAGPTANALGTDPDSFPNSLPEPDYPVGVIAGLREGGFAKALMPGDHDGLVPVESTKVAGMSDFIVVETSHSLMRYNEEVARQTIAFLRKGEFLRKP